MWIIHTPDNVHCRICLMMPCCRPKVIFQTKRRNMLRDPSGEWHAHTQQWPVLFGVAKLLEATWPICPKKQKQLEQKFNPIPMICCFLAVNMIKLSLHTLRTHLSLMIPDTCKRLYWRAFFIMWFIGLIEVLALPRWLTQTAQSSGFLEVHVQPNDHFHRTKCSTYQRL